MRPLVHGGHTVTFDQCEFGSPFMKTTAVLGPAGAAHAMQALHRRCTHRAHAATAVGEASALSAVYPPALCVAFADVIEGHCLA